MVECTASRRGNEVGQGLFDQVFVHENPYVCLAKEELCADAT